MFMIIPPGYGSQPPYEYLTTRGNEGNLLTHCQICFVPLEYGRLNRLVENCAKRQVIFFLISVFYVWLMLNSCVYLLFFLLYILIVATKIPFEMLTREQYFEDSA